MAFRGGSSRHFDVELFAFWSIYFAALIAVPWVLVWALT